MFMIILVLDLLLKGKHRKINVLIPPKPRIELVPLSDIVTYLTLLFCPGVFMD